MARIGGSFKRENQLDMEQFIVAGCDTSGVDQPLATGKLVNNTSALGVANGQIGVLAWDFFSDTTPLGEFIPAGTTAADVRAIKIIQGTPASANINTVDPFEAGHRGYIETGVIYCGNVRSVTVRKPRPGRFGNGSFVDFADCLPVCDVEYCLNVRISNVITSRDFGSNDDVINVSFEAPASMASVTDPLDFILQSVMFKLNLRSKLVSQCTGGFGNRDVLGLAINTAGGAGVPIGALTCGDVIPVMQDTCAYCKDCGNPESPVETGVTVTIEMLRSLACTIVDQEANPNIVKPITSTSTIEIIDLATAGTAPNVDAIIVLGLERDPAAVLECNPSDGIPQYQTRVDVDLCGAFRTSPLFKSCKCLPEEAINDGRAWTKEFNRRERHNVHSLQSLPSAWFQYGQTFVDPSKSYTSYIVDYFDHEETLTVQEQSPKQAVMLFCAGWDCTAETTDTIAGRIRTFRAGPDATRPDKLMDVNVITSACCANCTNGVPVPSANTVPDLEAVLGAWLQSARSASKFSVIGDAQSAGPFIS